MKIDLLDDGRSRAQLISHYGYAAVFEAEARAPRIMPAASWLDRLRAYLKRCCRPRTG